MGKMDVESRKSPGFARMDKSVIARHRMGNNHHSNRWDASHGSTVDLYLSHPLQVLTRFHSRNSRNSRKDQGLCDASGDSDAL
jgi:hypothetical protein